MSDAHAYQTSTKASEVSLTLTFKVNAAYPGDFAMMVADRFKSIINEEWKAGGEDLMGYDGPLVLDEPKVSTSAQRVSTEQDSGEPVWTVAGYWSDDDTRHVTAVMAGSVEVTGGDFVTEGGPFTVLVSAATAEEAEERVEGTEERDSCEGPRPAPLCEGCDEGEQDDPDHSGLCASCRLSA